MPSLAEAGIDAGDSIPFVPGIAGADGLQAHASGTTAFGGTMTVLQAHCMVLLARTGMSGVPRARDRSEHSEESRRKPIHVSSLIDAS
jgi:hypothetical protein